MARDKIRKDKICLVCGGGFRATGKGNTCTPACRAKLARLKKADHKPEYSLLVKSKGQELPAWVAAKLKEVGQISTQPKKTYQSPPEKEPPKNEEKRPLSYREQLYNKKMGIK